MADLLLLGNMVQLAAEMHAGQFDKGGVPYILHPIRVMQSLGKDDEELLCIAVGHDLLEDTACTIGDLYDKQMTERIVNGIVALTKVDGETRHQYRQKVLANIDAIVVKMADIKDNMDLARLKGVREKDKQRMLDYTEFYVDISIAQQAWWQTHRTKLVTSIRTGQ